ncbi:lactonase family protein [Demequina sp. B12]|uniref:lactonase family protein n=1 Tax=Demequina sp. B12 TaxID=2992757 RepID=UPI00237A3A20|nr:beta-propeller fold lactonase family protein [Demequina sp. B12]MDE0573693.1 lactonase family protein [Demequina sp. B12]
MTDNVWWGTYPEAGLGSPTGVGEGIWRQTPQDAALALELPAPSFMVLHPSLPLLYAVSEEDESVVHAVDVSEPAAPRVVSSVATLGAGACHVLIAADARTLYVSHYTSGTLAVVSVGEDGHFTDDSPAQVFSHQGSGPNADRQDAPHAHFAGFGPGGHHVLVADLGTDELRRYALRPDGLLDNHGVAARLPGGSGPRHFVVNGDLIYVACELTGTLVTLRWDAHAGEAEAIDIQDVTTAPPRTADQNYPSHLILHDSLLLTGVRGADVISVHDLSPEGHLNYRTAFDAGHWPRHFAINGDTLHVGAERGHEVRAYALADVEALDPEQEVGQVVTLAHAAAALPSPAFAIGHRGSGTFRA